MSIFVAVSIMLCCNGLSWVSATPSLNVALGHGSDLPPARSHAGAALDD